MFRSFMQQIELLMSWQMFAKLVFASVRVCCNSFIYLPQTFIDDEDDIC